LQPFKGIGICSLEQTTASATNNLIASRNDSKGHSRQDRLPASVKEYRFRTTAVSEQRTSPTHKLETRNSHRRFFFVI